MKDLTVSQILQVIHDLPTPNEVKGDYVRVMLRNWDMDVYVESPKECNFTYQVVEFKKTYDKRDWIWLGDV